MCSLFLVELKPSHPSMKEGKLQRPERQQVFPHTIQLKYDGNFVCVWVCVSMCMWVCVWVVWSDWTVQRGWMVSFTVSR